METEMMIYNMVVQMEAIQLHELSLIIQSKNGIVLDLNSDAITCIFPDDKFPFELYDDNVNIRGFYHDKLRQVPKYKLEDKDDRIRVERMKYQLRTKTDAYEHKYIKQWEILEDLKTNDFSEYVNNIINDNKSINIDGRAGTGKSTLVKMIQEEMAKRSINYTALAPTK